MRYRHVHCLFKVKIMCCICVSRGSDRLSCAAGTPASAAGSEVEGEWEGGRVLRGAGGMSRSVGALGGGCHAVGGSAAERLAAENVRLLTENERLSIENARLKRTVAGLVMIRHTHSHEMRHDISLPPLAGLVRFRHAH